MRIITDTTESQFTGAGTFKLNAGNTLTLTLDGSTQNATFAGSVDVNGSEITVGTNNSRFAENNLRFLSSGAAFIDHNTVGQSFIFRTSASSSLDTTALTIASSGNATFAGSITIPEYIVHSGDTDTFFGFVTNDEYKVTVGNSTKIFADANAAYLYYQGNQKIRTTNTGINVTGGITGDDSVFIEGYTNPNFTAHDITNETYTSLWSGDSQAALTFNHSLFRITYSAFNFTGTDIISISSSGVSTFYGSILPGTDSNHDLGSTTFRWENIWVDNINGGTPVNGSGTANDVMDVIVTGNILP